MHFADITWWEMTKLVSFCVFLPNAALQAMAFYASTKFEYLSKRQVYKVSYAPGQLRREIMGTLILFPLDILILTAALKLLWGSFEPTYTITTILFGIFGFEFLFYVTHRILHTKSFWWIHRHHHESRVVNPFSATAFNLVDRLILWVLTGLTFYILSLFVPVSFEGIILYQILQHATNNLGHLNVEALPPRLSRSPLFFWIAFPSYHSLHHARVSANFGGGVRIYDMLFGTEFPDHREVQQRAYEGNGFTRLAERARAQTNLVEKIKTGELSLTADVPETGIFHRQKVFEHPSVKKWLEAELTNYSGTISRHILSRVDDKSSTWYLRRDTEVFGPMTLSQLCDLKHEQVIGPRDFCFSLNWRLRIDPKDLPETTSGADPGKLLYMNRREARSQFQCAISLRGEEESIRALTVDVAKSGAAIYVKKPLQAGDFYRAEFLNLSEAERFQTDVEIVNVKPFGDGYRCGVVFRNLERKASAQWVALMEKNRAAVY